ncbi:recombinase family protein [Fluviibacterium sp. DFM31]|uniref:Recombinase family protein n=1 Tax=Meridianimarinicoccus marinus TaxID=3231483 RepID=A0ABV3L4W6_9RHOB
MAEVVTDVRAQGHTSLRAMARELNRRGIQTRRGGHWHASNVRNIVKRIEGH